MCNEEIHGNKEVFPCGFGAPVTTPSPPSHARGLGAARAHGSSELGARTLIQGPLTEEDVIRSSLIWLLFC